VIAGTEPSSQVRGVVRTVAAERGHGGGSPAAQAVTADALVRCYGGI